MFAVINKIGKPLTTLRKKEKRHKLPVVEMKKKYISPQILQITNEK